MTRRFLTAVLMVSACVCACGDDDARIEGTEPGDCSDGADNDADGLFDCNDPGCAGAPACTDAGADSGTDAGDDGSIDAGADGAVDANDAGPEATLFPARDFVCETPARGCTTDVPARSDEERTATEPGGMDGVTLTYIVSMLAIPEAEDGNAMGLNLDGTDALDGDPAASAACDRSTPDFTAIHDPLHAGVDNAVQALIPTAESLMTSSDCGGDTDGCIDRLIADQIASGMTLILVEVGGVDSFLYDANVRVRLYEVSIEDGPALDASNIIAPGQSFLTVRALSEEVDGDIFAGRLRAPMPTLDISPLTEDSEFLIVVAPLLNDAEIRADIDADGLSNGVIAASMLVEDVVAQASAIYPGQAGVIRAVITSFADLQPSEEDDEECEVISLGLDLDAVVAERL